MSRRWKVFSKLVIGRQDNPMMKRIRLIQTPKFGIYLHFIYREDADRDLHDHPWTFWRIVLKGGYDEIISFNPSKNEQNMLRRVPPWRKVVRWQDPANATRAKKLFDKFKTNWAHRITSVDKGTVTLVIVGPKVRKWGFWVPNECVTGKHDFHIGYKWVESEKYFVQA